MTARERVLADIRRSLGRERELDAERAQALRDRLAAPAPHTLPAVGEELVGRFVAKLEAAGGLASRVGSLSEVVDTVAAHLHRYGLGTELVVGGQRLLERIPWPADWVIRRGTAGGNDPVSVTGAFAGVAETGTVVLLSGPEHPSTLNFLPDDHLVVLRSASIVSHVEDAWRMIRALPEGMPRTVNLVTGPSRTADVEQTIQVGAHGPRRFHAILVEREQ